MSHYLVIEPDGTLTEAPTGSLYDFGCHGTSGQNLFDTREYVNGLSEMWRMVGCDCALIMPEDHEPNPIARGVLRILGYSAPVRGRIALCRVDWEGDAMQLQPKHLDRMRTIMAGVRAAEQIRTEPEGVPTIGVYQLCLGDDGQIHAEPVIEPVHVAQPDDEPR